MRKLLIFAALFLCGGACLAQSIPVTYQWDASSSPNPSPDNPIKYNFYTCTDQALTSCTKTDAGTATTVTIQMSSGNYWVYVTAYCYAVSADNPSGPYTGGPVQESSKSNIVATRVTVPPGNPANAKVIIK